MPDIFNFFLGHDNKILAKLGFIYKQSNQGHCVVSFTINIAEVKPLQLDVFCQEYYHYKESGEGSPKVLR
jgi:hypothetical protein